MPTLATLEGVAVAGLDAKEWYTMAGESVGRYASAIGEGVERVASVLACLSPRCTVLENVSRTIEYFERGTFSGLPSVRKQLDHYLRTGYIRGRKCRNFARAILGDGSALVLDTHMARVLNVGAPSLATKWCFSAAYRKVSKVAERLGLTVAETQASLWCGIQGGNCEFLFIG